MLGRKFLELIDRKPVTDHLLVGHDIGRALTTLEQRRLAEAQAGPNRSDPLLSAVLSRHFDLDANRAARHYEEQFGFSPLTDNDLALLEDQWLHQGLDEPIVLGAQAFEQIELGKRELRPRASGRGARQ